jgi:uracil-DNA glycosylase
MKIALDHSWGEVIHPLTKKPYYKNITRFLQREYESRKKIYPEIDNVFKALQLTPFDNIKVVILGQDPYHGAGQANGLAFSVLEDVKIPPSLQNIFKELQSDIGACAPKNGSLLAWAKQGVFLLNSSLTVEADKPNSHATIGWHQFTDDIISEISNRKEGIIFLLWGKFAQNKKMLIDTTKHFILEAPHPSPLSAHKGFLGCKHFSKVNEILKKNNQKLINWKL